MKKDVSVLSLARLIAASPKLGDEELAAKLRGSGIESELAEQALALVPTASARALLARSSAGTGLRFSDEAEVGMPDSGRPRVRLVDLPLFSAASSLASQCASSSLLTSAEVLAIAGRSAEFKLVNSMLISGQSTKDLIFAPLRLCRI
jgi:hypothetical protein